MTSEPVQRKLQFVLQAYGIKPRENFRFSYFSMANEVFFLRDAHNRRLVLKNCLKNRSPELLEAELALCDHLRSQGCGAPETVAATDGRRIVEHDGDWWLMTKHLKGHMPSWSSRLHDWHFSQTIKGLALYHKAASTFDPSVDNDRIKSWEYRRTLDWCLDLEKRLAADGSGRASVERMRVLVKDFIGLARRLPGLLPEEQVRQCETLMIHGDFHCFNVVFRRHRFHACYDFDFMRRDLKLFDICWSLNFITRRFLRRILGTRALDRSHTPTPGQVAEIYRRTLAYFVRHYRRYWRLSDTELRLLPGMYAAMALYNLRFFDLEHSEAECLEHCGWYERLLANIRDNSGVLAAAIEEVCAGARP